MGQHQQVFSQHEMDVLRAQRNAALDTVAHWQGRANESADEVRRLTERVRQLEAVNSNYAKEIEDLSSRLKVPKEISPLERAIRDAQRQDSYGSAWPGGAVPCNVTMLNTAPTSSGNTGGGWIDTVHYKGKDRRTNRHVELEWGERRGTGVSYPDGNEGVGALSGKSWNNEVMASVHAQGSPPAFKDLITGTPVESLDHA